MARRFIVDSRDITKIEENKIQIVGREVKHIQVLRHNVGDIIVLNEYDCKIISMKSHSIDLEILQNTNPVGIPNINTTLYIGMLKNDKMDFVVQKAVELGVKNIVPFFSKNVVVKLDDKARIKRIEKLQTIANEACKQCGRTDIVTISAFENFKNIIDKQNRFDASIIAYENDKTPLRDTISNIKKENVESISIIIGAEGGFDRDEVDLLLENSKAVCVSLGSRILRAETAALSLLSIVMYELD